MKVDILTHADASQFQTKKAAYFGGAIGYAHYMAAGLQENGHDVKIIINDEAPRKDADFYFLSSFGVDKERNDKGKAASDKKYSQLRRLSKPIIPLIHSSYEYGFYKHSLPQLIDLKPRTILVTTRSEANMKAILECFPKAKIELLKIPFRFEPKLLSDKSRFARTIASPARIAAIKGTAKVLDLAEILPKYKFLVCGKKAGMFWQFGLSKHSHVNGKNITWAGPQEPMKILDNAAFSMDLTIIWYKGLLDGERVQYTTLEAICAGCIPIVWEQWKFPGGWDGVYLPKPHKEGVRVLWDKEQCADLIRSAKYDFNMAQENFNKMKKLHDYRKIATQLERIAKAK